MGQTLVADRYPVPSSRARASNQAYDGSLSAFICGKALGKIVNAGVQYFGSRANDPLFEFYSPQQKHECNEGQQVANKDATVVCSGGRGGEGRSGIAIPAT